jgi:hypothetical protein
MRSSSGHNTCVPNHPESSTLYTLWVLLCLGKKTKNKKPLCGFFGFFLSTRFVHALQSSVKSYLEIENLIGLGGVFNSKLDFWVLLKKGNFYFLLVLLFLDKYFINFSHGPKETSPTLKFESCNQ